MKNKKIKEGMIVHFSPKHSVTLVRNSIALGEADISGEYIVTKNNPNDGDVTIKNRLREIMVSIRDIDYPTIEATIAFLYPECTVYDGSYNKVIGCPCHYPILDLPNLGMPDDLGHCGNCIECWSKIFRHQDRFIQEYSGIDTPIQKEYVKPVEETPVIKSYLDIIREGEDEINISIIAKDYGITAVDFNTLLKILKVQYKLNGIWVLYPEHAEKEYTILFKGYVKDNSEYAIYTKWTKKGREFIYNTLKEHNIMPTMELLNPPIVKEEDNKALFRKHEKSQEELTREAMYEKYNG